jgi:hypothetical protein
MQAKNPTLFIVYLLFGLFSFTACEKEDPQDDSYTIPVTYSFENVDYSGQLIRQDMMEEITTLMKTGDAGQEVDAATLKAMYNHQEGAGDFSDQTLNASGKNLKSKTFPDFQDLYETFMDELAIASMSDQAGSMGQAGVVISTTSEKAYLLNENGVEYTQLIEKGLMGSCFLYQALAVYLGDIENDDNQTIEAGKGTEQEHHFDEAFGYFGVSPDFPGNTSDVRFWGKYCNGRDDLLGTNALVMDAFLKGRAAISNKDDDARDEAVAVITDTWEKVSAATAIHYLNSARSESKFDDLALRCHALSEAVAFIQSTRFSPEAKMTQTQVENLLVLIGGSTEWTELNFYAASKAKLTQAIEEISAIYEFDTVKFDL